MVCVVVADSLMVLGVFQEVDIVCLYERAAVQVEIPLINLITILVLLVF